MTEDFPLTPAVAIAIAAILDAHKPHLPHWTRWADDLRAWADRTTDKEEPTCA